MFLVLPYEHIETCSEPCQTSEIERFAKIVDSYEPLTIFENAPSDMFDIALNTLLDT